MIKQLQDRLAEKGIYLVVNLAVRAFLTDEGYDPIYGARPLRRAIMSYLEDTLAEQCLAKTLYPNTKLLVNRKKVPGSLFNYTNELEVEIDFSDVDPNLLNRKKLNRIDSEPKSKLASLSATSQVNPQSSDGNVDKKSDDTKSDKEVKKKRSRLRPGIFGRKKNQDSK